MTGRKGAVFDGLRPNKRYICTHDAAGKSVYAESPDQVFNVQSGFGGLAKSYSIGSVPAKLADEQDIKAYRADDGGPMSYRRRDIVSPQPGANLLVIDIAPGGVSAMHRTVSVDFSICVIGEVEHELDGGEKVTLYPGDHIIQRGTNHRWRNLSTTQPARFVAVTLPCEPFDVVGQPLQAKFVSSEEWDRSKSKL